MGRENGASHRKANQDACLALSGYQRHREQSLFGVFDGHGPNGDPRALGYPCPCHGASTSLPVSAHETAGSSRTPVAANEGVWATAGEKMAGFVQQQLPHVLGQLLALEAGDDGDALRRGVSALEMHAPDAASCTPVYSEELGGLAQGAC